MLTMNEKIVALRHRHNMSQMKLAKELGLSAPTVIGREMGRTEWRMGEVEKMARIFKVPVSDLLGDLDVVQ